ncbi:hypothetical protein [Treponema primitia]|uniref:hypothetical protein n=1 Tax=Treponema primitia TaxID=88058 RepID=UPI0002555888|nr:hypothetical protein [Treponema primitia]
MYRKVFQGTGVLGSLGGAFLKGRKMGFNLTNVDYQEFLEKKEYIGNARIRPDDMNIFEWLSVADADMKKTPEGQQLIAALQSVDD